MGNSVEEINQFFVGTQVLVFIPLALLALRPTKAAGAGVFAAVIFLVINLVPHLFYDQVMTQAIKDDKITALEFAYNLGEMVVLSAMAMVLYMILAFGLGLVTKALFLRKR